MERWQIHRRAILWLKGLVFSAGFLLLLYILPPLIFSIPAVQRSAAEAVEAELEHLLQTKVSLGRVTLHEWNDISIEHLIICDSLGREALRLGELRAGFEWRRLLLDEHVHISSIRLFSPHLDLFLDGEEGKLNISPILEQLSRGDTTSRTSLGLQSLLVRDGSVRLTISEGRAVEVDSITLNLSRLVVEEPFYGCNIQEISLRYARELELRQFSGQIQMQGSLLSLSNLQGALPSGRVHIPHLRLNMGAIVQYLDGLGTPLGGGDISEVETLTGRGISGVWHGELLLLGNRRLMQERGVRITQGIEAEAQRREAEGETVIFVSYGAELVALLSLSDEIKPSSKEAVGALRQMGIEVHILTGDNHRVAKALSDAVGVDAFLAEALPEGKADYIRRLRAEGKCVGMVGDGINDSIALAEANLSIAMGGGNDVAMQTAMATIVSGDLKGIASLIRLSRETKRTIRQNLFWAFIYNLIAIPVAAGVLYPIMGYQMNPMLCSLAMALSSVSVVANSLRLRKG